MKKWVRSVSVALIGIAALGVLAWVGQRIHAANAAEPPTTDASAYRAEGEVVAVDAAAAVKAGIEVASITPRDVPMTLTLTGRSGLNMETVTHVRAQFGGKVVNIGPPLGAAVNGPESPAGPTVLCVIESNDLAQAKASFIQAKIQARQDEDTYNRTRELVEAKVLAEKFLIDALSTLVKDKAAMEAARQQLLIFGLKQSEIDQVQNEVGRQRMDYVITSPRTGVIAEKGIAGGEIADPSLNLFTVADTDTMWVWGDVYERDLSKVKEGQPLKIYFTSEPQRARDCKIDWISPVLDPNTHSVKIRGVLDNKDKHLLSDMYGTIIVTVDAGKHALIVPSDAIIRQDQDSYVFVRITDSGNKARYRRTRVTIEPVDVGFGASESASAAAGATERNSGYSPQAPGAVRVVDGIKPGDVIVTSGGLGLFNAMEEQAKDQ